MSITSGSGFTVGSNYPPGLSEVGEVANYRMQVLSILDRTQLADHDRKGAIIGEAEELIKRIVGIFPDNQRQEVVNAVLDMLKLHAGQAVRLNGELVVEHLLETTNLLLNIVKDPQPEEVVAALLHDAIEDRVKEVAHQDREDRVGSSLFVGDDERWALLFASLRMEHVYGEKIRKMLIKLLKPNYKEEVAKISGSEEPDIDEFTSIKNRLYKNYIEKALDDPEVAMIKLADFITNASDANAIPDNRAEDRKRIQDKYSAGFPLVLGKFNEQSFRDRLKDPDGLHHQMATVFERHYKNDIY